MRMSSLEKKQQDHDVFLNFRGEDSRFGFTSYLREALNKRPISTFNDEDLPKGRDVWEAIAEAIQASSVSILIFSEKYATSTWCLRELVQILDCREKQNHIVIPVFYKVNPSDVRHQRGSYGDAFAKHDQDPGTQTTETNQQKVLSWKAALTVAANISGWHCGKDKKESVVINDIVDDVWKKLHLPDPTEQPPLFQFNVRDESVATNDDESKKNQESVVIKYIVNDEPQKLHLPDPTQLKGPVGDEENYRNVESLLRTDKVIGIWGKGGIGKSTIAGVLFAKCFSKYDHVCAVNAKEYWLNKLFSELWKEEVFPPNVDIGRLMSHMRRLRGKKIFIILDDVNMDSLDPLTDLYREYEFQHLDSRLIITTRDKHLLEGRVNRICEVKEWKIAESLKLFCLEAFNKSYPQKGYESLSARAVGYAGGVPLALKVLGSHFHGKSTEFWEKTLSELNKYPNEKIQKVLEVSYYGLSPLQKEIFLDIVFFFKEKEKDRVLRILDACGFEATRRIKNLAYKALLTISKSKIIQMHDLLQQMGLEIVRLENKDDPGKRSRLKDKEAREVIQHNKGTDAIQGIALDLSQIENLPLHADTFTKMKALRFLKFYNTLGQSSSNTYLNLPTTLEPFSNELRYIEWIAYPFESLPSPFCAEFLVEIHMPHSKVKQLWQGMQTLNNLERIQLSGCQQFEELPDLSKAPKLKWVNLSCCESLQRLHPSVLSSDKLVTLILDKCTKLESVKGEKHLESLSEISVNGCLSLEEFAVSSDSVINLDLSNTGIQTLGTEIGSMKNLRKLNLESLRLRHFVKELSELKSLKELKLSDTWQVIDKEKLRVLFDGLRSLQILHMKEFSNLFELPDNISVLSELYELRLDGSNVRRLPESIKNLEELEILSLENCKELRCLPMLPSRIKNIGAINCKSLVSVSNMNTLARKMFGMTKIITFRNSLKLDGHSWELIMESLQLTMMHAVFDNVASRYYDSHGYNYTSVQLCLPGSRLPRHIKYQATKSSITIELPQHSNCLGFIYSMVVSKAGAKKQHGTKIKCKCLLPKEGMKEAWIDSDMVGLESDHVYVWYDPLHCDSILKYRERKMRFEFCVADAKGKVDDSICIEQCGIRPVTVSEVSVVLNALDTKLDFDTKSKMKWLVKRYVKWEITDSTAGPESNTEKVELDSAEEDNERKNYYSDVEESFNSTHKETETDSAIDCRQNTRRSKERSISKREDVATEGRDQISQSKTENVGINILSKSTVEKGSNVEAKNQERPTIQPEDKGSSSRTEEEPKEPGLREMKFTTSAPDNLPEKLLNNKPNSLTREYTPLTLDDCLNQIDENPFILLDFVSMEVSMSSKQSESSDQQSSTNENFEAALDELRELAFSQCMTKNVKDVEYGKKLEAAVQNLENFPRELNEELNGKIKSFFDLYNQACEIVKEQGVTCDTMTQVNAAKDADFDKLKTARNQVKQLEDVIMEFRPKIEELEKRENDLSDKIKKLKEDLSGVEKDKAKLEAVKAKNIAEKTDFVASAKHVSTNLARLLKQKKELEKSQAKLFTDFEALEKRYNKMRAEPPF